MVLYPNKLPESERVCSGICKQMHFNFCSCAPVSFRNNDCITYSQSGYDSILSLIPLHTDIVFSKISNRGDTQKTLVVCMKHNSKIQSFDKQNDVTDRESYTWKRVSMIGGGGGGKRKHTAAKRKGVVHEPTFDQF